MSKSRSTRTSPFAIALRKFVVSGFVVFSFVAYVVHDRLANADPSNAETAPANEGAQVQLMLATPYRMPTSQPVVPTSQQIVPVSNQQSNSQNGQILQPTNTPFVPTATPFIPTDTPIPPTATPFVPTDTPVPPTATSQGQYKDGVYTGPTVDAFYGLVQVQATVQGGKLTDVQFLQYPHDRRTSQEINQQAMPWLTQEAVQAQSAYINIISGATFTSQAFAQSLYDALNQAAN